MIYAEGMLKVGVSYWTAGLVLDKLTLLSSYCFILAIASSARMINLKSLSDLIKEYGLTEMDLNQPVSSQHCDRIAINVGADWERLATAIGFEDYEIGDIRGLNLPLKDKRRMLVREWKKKYGNVATYTKMAEGLEEIQNRGLTELLLMLLKQDLESHQLPTTAETRKKKFLVICVTALITGIAMYSLLKDNSWIQILHVIEQLSTSTPLNSSEFHEQINFSVPLDSSAMVQSWSPKFQHSINCSQPIGCDLPVLHGVFVGREDDIKEIISKVKGANILNINGAPGFGKSTAAIHVGYKLLEKCIPVRYINIEELSWTALSEVKDKSKIYGIKHNPIATKETAALATQFSSLTVAREDHIYSEYDTATSAYIKELQQWSKALNYTTVLILDNADIALTSPNRERLIDLISLLVHNSNFHLHIVVVSQEKLVFLENFDRWTIRQLSQQASVELLNELAPGFIDSQLKKIAELLQGCPLALKVIGNILKIYGEIITYELEKELQRHPIYILDKVSDHRKRFSVMMDLILSKLEFIRKCGYMVSLFPGSFSREAGVEILGSRECLDIFEKQSLLDEYFHGAYQHRYNMHRLIKEYLKEKVNSSDMIVFERRFCEHYTQHILHYASEGEYNDTDKHTISCESKNIDYLVEILLSDSQSRRIEELVVLVFLVNEDYIQIDELQSIYKQYLKQLSHVCEFLHPNMCEEFISHIVKHFFQWCNCDTKLKYIKKTQSEGLYKDAFDCNVVKNLFKIQSSLNLSLKEEDLLNTIESLHCQHIYTRLQAHITQLVLILFLIVAIILCYYCRC